VEKTVKPSPIFIARVNNIQLLEEIAIGDYQNYNNNEQIKIQPKNSIAYINIMKKQRYGIP